MSLPSLSHVFADLGGIVSAAEEPLRPIAEYAISGGKGCRAQIVLDSARPSHVPAETILRAAALIELLHAATLLQDDLFDGSRTRRGRPAAWLRFTPQLATLAADWMLAEAIRLAFRLGSGFGEALCGCAQQLIAGEAREARSAGPRTRASLERHALLVAQAKTGELFGLALAAAALLGSAMETARALATAGRAIGLAFQYLDDVVDLIGDPSAAAKDTGRDKDLHLVTMPMLELWPLLSATSQEALLHPGSGLSVRLHAELARPDLRRHLLHCAERRWAASVDQVRLLLPDAALLDHLSRTCNRLRAHISVECPAAETAA